jgi:hypothetical protein
MMEVGDETAYIKVERRRCMKREEEWWGFAEIEEDMQQTDGPKMIAVYSP